MRFTEGEYYLPNSIGKISLPTVRARLHFLDALGGLVPDFEGELRTRLDQLPAQRESAKRIRSVIRAWGRSHNLHDEWILEGIVEHLGWGRPVADYRWHDCVDAEESTADFGDLEEVVKGWSLYPPCPSDPFVLEHPGFDMSRTTRAQVEVFLTEAFRRALAQYIKQIDVRAEELSWHKTPTKRRRNRGVNATMNDEYAHFRWLVQFQCLNRTYEEIAREANVVPSCVADAVRQTAKQISLSLRTDGKRGRPKKRSQ